MALIGWSSSWVDTVRPVKAAIRAYMRDQLAHYFATAAEVNATSTAVTKAILIGGAPFILDAADVTTADDGVNVIVSSDGGRYKRASVAREKLVANRTYYVRTDGSDANGGLANTAAGAFLTIQKAIDVACALDLSIYSTTVNVGAGTFAKFTCKPYVGTGPISIVGASTTIDVAAGVGVTAYDAGSWQVSGITWSNSANTIHAKGRTSLTINGTMTYGAASNAHILAENGAIVTATADYTIAGSSPTHIQSVGALVDIAGRTITLTGTPAWSFTMVYVSGLGRLKAFSNTFTGAATGRRFIVEDNGLIRLNGGGANYFPGDVAGLQLTGGQYV